MHHLFYFVQFLSYFLLNTLQWGFCLHSPCQWSVLNPQPSQTAPAGLVGTARGIWTCLHDGSGPDFPQVFTEMPSSHPLLLKNSTHPHPQKSLSSSTYTIISSQNMLLILYCPSSPSELEAPGGQGLCLCVHCCIPSHLHGTWYMTGTPVKWAE